MASQVVTRPNKTAKMASQVVVSATLAAFVSCVLLAMSCQGQTQVTVTTGRGQIVGLEESVVLPDDTQHTLRVFRGIPYAAPPVAALRFSKPVPAANFSRPFQAFEFGPACPQQRPVAGNVSEDCLTLNVYAPNPTAQQPSLPVIVWIHGGAFVYGEARQLPGENLASFANVVVVTMNFRLGALGFLSTDDAEAPGNWGLWDQRLALQWVSENIRHFGGAPGNVTLAGTTSGAICVTHHALFPGNAGLFRRIVVESGTAVSLAAYHTKGFRYAEALANKLECALGHSESAPGPSPQSIIACLREKDFRSIANAKVRADQPFTLTWAPVVDGDFIDQEPSTILSWPPSGSPLLESRLGSLQALIGTTSSDGSIVLKIFVPPIAAAMNESTESGVSRPLFEKNVKLLVAPSQSAGSDVVGVEVSEAVRHAVLQEYTDWSKPMDWESRGRRLVDLFTDDGFYIPSATFTRILAGLKNSPTTFMYEFNQRSLSPAPKNWLRGSLHKDHDVFVMGFPDALLPNGITLDVDSDDGAALWNFSKTVMTYWGNFVKTGNPNSPEPVPVEWPPFTFANEEYLHLEAAGTAARRHCRARETAFWLDYVPKIKKNKCKGEDVTNESAVTSYSLNMRLMMSIGYLVMYYNKFL